MKKEKKQQQELQQQLETLEAELQTAYLQLGKKTQEFVEHESDEINQLVDEIIVTKKALLDIEHSHLKEREIKYD